MSAEGSGLLQLIRQRITVERFQPGRPLDEGEIRDLVADAIRAPSSFNIQHWRFVAVRHPDDKRRLTEAAYGQSQVADASVTFILLGDLQAVETRSATTSRAVASGALPEARAEAWCRMAEELYADPQLARDEAIRSCSLAAMTLMLAAEARGLGAGALVGFDPDRVRRDFEIADRYLPVMLLTVGYPCGEQRPRMPRRPASEVLAFDRGREF